MKEVLSQHEFSHSTNKNELLSLIFSDLRFTLMFRRCWLEEEIKEGIQENVLLEKISSIQEKCE